MTSYTPPAILVSLVISFLAATGCLAGEIAAVEKGAPNISVEPVTFQNRQVILAGSLVVREDKSKAPKPAVIFVAGSGPGPRELFQTIADWYVNQGFIALIYDKRGSGASGGDWLTSSLDDLAGDVVAGLELLAKDHRVDTARIGIYGVSQAGWVMPIAAGRSDIPDWVIAITGGGATPRAAETFAYRQALADGGIDEASTAEAMKLLDRYFDYLADGQGRQALVDDIETAKAEPWYPYMPLGNILPAPANQPNWSWVGAYDPLPDIARMSIPTLALLGARDTRSSAEESAAGWIIGMEKSGVRGAMVKVFETAGHGLMTGSHEAAMHGKPSYVAGYFEVQRAWLRQRGVLPD